MINDFTAGTTLASGYNVLTQSPTDVTERYSMAQIFALLRSSAQSFTGIISPTTLATDTDDWSPTGFSDAGIVRVSSSSAVDLTGLTAGGDGRLVVLINVGSYTITLKDEDASSSAANRFAFTADFELEQDAACWLVYDDTRDRWGLMGGGGGGGTTYEVGTSSVLWSYEVTGSAEQTINVDSGILNHERLQVIIDVVNDSGSTAVYDLYINNSSGTIDTTQANYTSTLTAADVDTSPTNQTAEYDQPRVLDCAAGDEGRGIIDLSVNSSIIGMVQSVRRDGTKNHTVHDGCVEYETTMPAAFTELRFYSSVASGFGVGTKITVIDPNAAQSGVPDVWRDEETRIPGEWWQDPDNTDDYYPKYRKVIDLGALPNNSTTNTAHGVTNYHLNSVHVHGRADDSSSVSYDLPYIDPTSLGNGVSCYHSGTNIRVKTGSNRSSNTGHAIMEYAKTTDTPVTYEQAYGNGGAPFDDYSTSETLTGKLWLGSPVYRKVVALSNKPTAGSSSTNAHGVSGISQIIRCEACFIDSGDHFSINGNNTASSTNDEYVKSDTTNITWHSGVNRSSATGAYGIIEYTKS